MTSKSELKRKATCDPIWAANRIAVLEAVADATRFWIGPHNDCYCDDSGECTPCSERLDRVIKSLRALDAARDGGGG